MGHGPGAGRWETERRRAGGGHPHQASTNYTGKTTKPLSPHTHTHTQKRPVPHRPVQHTHTHTLPLFNTEAIINTCNNIFTASNSLLQIRTSSSCTDTPPPPSISTWAPAHMRKHAYAHFCPSRTCRTTLTSQAPSQNSWDTRWNIKKKECDRFSIFFFSYYIHMETAWTRWNVSSWRNI